jgi:hypothetical protein
MSHMCKAIRTGAWCIENAVQCWAQWLIPIIPANQEAELMRTKAPVQLRQKVRETPSQPMSWASQCHGKHKQELHSPGQAGRKLKTLFEK